MSPRPKSLTFIAVVAIVLGVTTALTSLSNVLALNTMSFGTPATAREGTATGVSSAIVAAQAEFHRRTLEINGRHRRLFLTVIPFALIAAAAMIVGGVKALSMRRWSRPVLWAGMSLALVVDLICAKPQLETQLEIADATSTLMKTMVETMDAASISARPGARAAQSMLAVTEAMTKMTATAGVVVHVAIAAGQLAFLVFGLVYLSRTRTRELFAAG